MDLHFCVVLLATTAAAINIDQLSNKLQPVQSLYVKPSADGSTGDLYVAATEDNCISRWLTDSPVNFLNSAALALKSAAMLPANLSPGFPAAIINQEESANQKPAVINSGSSQIETVPKNAQSSIVQNVQTEQPTEITSVTPSQSPFQYSPYFMYPNLLTSAVTDQKEGKEKDVSANAALAQAHAAYWPSAAYSYATYPYMMMDPRFWAWAQAAAAAANQAPNTEGTADENTKE